MRTESDVHGPHGPSAPGCAHCGLPLHPEAMVCPFCEREIEALDLGTVITRVAAPPSPPPPTRFVAGVPERTVMVIGACSLAAVAVVALVLSALV